MRLAQLQRALQAHILRGHAAITALVPGSEGFDTATRLGVYVHGYPERLIEALAQTFPALRQSLGPERFASCLHRFALRAPSRHFSVRYYGAELPAFLARELAGTTGQVAADLARLEWGLAAAFDAADAAPLSAETLQQIPPSRWVRLRFELTPTLVTLELRSNAVQWWRAACEKGARPQRWRRQRPQHWLIWRRELAVYFRPAAPDERLALAAIARGASFGSMCERLARQRAGAATRAAELLRTWLDEGLLVAVRQGARAAAGSSESTAGSRVPTPGSRESAAG